MIEFLTSLEWWQLLIFGVFALVAGFISVPIAIAVLVVACGIVLTVALLLFVTAHSAADFIGDWWRDRQYRP